MGTKRGIDALPDFLKSCEGKPFREGEWDCIIFTNEAYRVMYGEGWCDDWIGRYSKNGRPLTKKKLQEEFGFETLVEGVDSKLTRVGKFPPRGALVTPKSGVLPRYTLSVAFGICLGTKCVYLYGNGYSYSGIEDIDKAWVKQNG